jgi:hypothetical protein
MRRGAAWPAEWSRSRLVVREHKHGWASQRAVARVAAKEVWTPAVLSSPCPRSCPASGVRCERPVSRGACPSDRCPVRASERPGVQCPASDVRPFRVSAVSDGNEVAGRGDEAGSCTAGMPGVGVVARHIHDGGSSARGWSLP